MGLFGFQVGGSWFRAGGVRDLLMVSLAMKLFSAHFITVLTAADSLWAPASATETFVA